MFRTRSLVVAVLLVVAAQAGARDRIQLVGSFSVLGFVQPAAEHFARHQKLPMPALEMTGTGAGFAMFCRGIGFEHADIVAAARPMTAAERELCASNGVTDITEIEFGREAMVLIHAGRRSGIGLTRRQLRSALVAKRIDGDELMDNAAVRWNEIDPALPNFEIRIMVPEPNTIAAIALPELVLSQGCQSLAKRPGLDDAQRERACRTVRGDGRVVDAPKSERAVVDWLEWTDSGYALTDYTTYRAFADRTSVNPVEGVHPDEESIANGRYPLVTGVFMYVKDQHVGSIPSLQEFLYELTSERALAPDGYLFAQGFVPLNEVGRNRARDQALKFGL